MTRTALQNAASIAGLLLTTEALVVEIPEPKAAPAAAATAAAWTACTEHLPVQAARAFGAKTKGLQLRLGAFFCAS